MLLIQVLSANNNTPSLRPQGKRPFLCPATRQHSVTHCRVVGQVREALGESSAMVTPLGGTPFLEGVAAMSSHLTPRSMESSK